MDDKVNMIPYIGWGNFVEVAYDMYAQNHVSPVTPANFPSGWNRIANLTMDPRLGSLNEREFAGYIAHSLDNPNLQIVVIRGTESALDWLSDFEFVLETFHEVAGGGKTERGFTNLYRSMTVEFVDERVPSVPLISQLDQLPAGTKLIVTGHSLGSSLATLHAFVAGSKKIDTELITFASPRVGDRDFAEAFQNMNIKNTRIFNQPDIVPKVPVELAGYVHIEPGVEVNSIFYPIKHSIPCYHALSTYLYAMGDEQANIAKCKSN